MLSYIFLLFFVAFVSLPETKEAILANEDKSLINIETSGSLGLYHHQKCHMTYGNETIVNDEYQEWCSNIEKDTKDPEKNPFIQYSIKGKRMKIKKYAVRNGCCRYECCCLDDGRLLDYYCCCTLYSYSLRASNDNKTWTLIHKIENDKYFSMCQTKTFELAKETEPFTYFRFVLDEQYPSCKKCMQVNQIELYGETIQAGFDYHSDSIDDDESISIIGRVKKNEA